MWFIHSVVLVEPPICWALYDCHGPCSHGGHRPRGETGINRTCLQKWMHVLLEAVLGSRKGPGVITRPKVIAGWTRKFLPPAGPLSFPLKNNQGGTRWCLSSFQLTTSLNSYLTKAHSVSQKAEQKVRFFCVNWLLKHDMFHSLSL